MLRMPRFDFHRPSSLEEAAALLTELGPTAVPIAGGTDLVPNMKHRLLEPDHLVSLKGVPEMRGIGLLDEQWLTIGAGESLSTVATHKLVRRAVPALAEAAGQVAGPQLRNMGTIGGNVCLDTRCTYFNQTHFWRQALGFCLKKDGDTCHVTKVGKKCVAAHSADTPPVLMTVHAELDLHGPDGPRTVSADDFFLPDGIWNSRRRPDELLVRIRIPLKKRRTAYAKLRQRKSIDFPLLTVAVAAEIERDGAVRSIDGVVTGLGARPRRLTGWDDIVLGKALDGETIAQLAERAHAQCRPLENMIVDPDWRRAMVPVYVRRALEGLIV